MHKIIALIATTTLLALNPYEAEEAKQMHTTAYCMGETTATGTPAREGVAATDKQHLGCIALVFENKNGEPGDLLKIATCEDTGKGGDRNNNGVGDIIEGLTIDIYQENEKACRDWCKLTNDEVWVVYLRRTEPAGTGTAQSATTTSKKGYTVSVTERKENASSRKSPGADTGAGRPRGHAENCKSI